MSISSFISDFFLDEFGCSLGEVKLYYKKLMEELLFVGFEWVKLDNKLEEEVKDGVFKFVEEVRKECLWY